jgi:alanine dehydrogenase
VNMAHETILLSQSDLESVIDLDDVCDTVEETFRQHGLGSVVLPAKITLDINPVDHQAWMNAMPAYVKAQEAAGIKWAGGFVNNPRDHNLPYVMATIMLNDPVTGQTLAVMDGAHITNVRTGAAAAVSAKHTAQPDVAVVAIIGAGTQGRWTLRALQRYFNISEVRVVDIRPEAVEHFIEEVQTQTDASLVGFGTADDAARGADLIFTATPADAPLVQDESIGPGATVVSIGSYQELDDGFVLAADKIIVDSVEQCLHRGELARLYEQGLLSSTDIHCELGELVAGRKTGRESPDERILVVPIGLGSLDIAVARKALTRAMQNGIGQRFAFTD